MVRVRLFARARDLAGSDRVSFLLTPGATVADLRRQLKQSLPALGDFLQRCAVALNNEVADDDSVLPADAEIALLPPVSGG